MVLTDAPDLISETFPVDSRKCVVAANDSMDSLTETLSNCQEQLRLAEQQLDERCEPLKEVPSEAPSLSHVGPINSPPPCVARRLPVKFWKMARSLPSNDVASPCRDDVPFKVADEKHLHVCVVLTSTGVCNGAILFCQSNLKHCNHVCQSSVVFLRCGHIPVSSVRQ